MVTIICRNLQALPHIVHVRQIEPTTQRMLLALHKLPQYLAAPATTAAAPAPTAMQLSLLMLPDTALRVLPQHWL